MGKWGEVSSLELWLPTLRKWVNRSWDVKKRARVSYLGTSFCYFEFENEENLDPVLSRGSRNFEDKLFGPGEMES